MRAEDRGVAVDELDDLGRVELDEDLVVFG
jgi:hypothetical protein